MADNTVEEELNSAADVVRGWNEKLGMGNAQLSQWIPFCELYAIFEDNYTPKNVGGIDYSKDAIDVLIKDDKRDAGKNVKIVPIFRLLTQQTSQNTTKAPYGMLAPRGPAGIESITVRFHNLELYSYMVNMDIAIPSLETEIVQNNSFRRLITFNTEWIIVYGWSKGENVAGGFFLKKQEGGNPILDLSAGNKGYYKVLRAMLTRYDFDIDKNKMVNGKLQFMSRFMNGTTIANVQRQRDLIKSLLQMSAKGRNTLIPTCPPEVKKQFSIKDSTTKLVEEEIEEQPANFVGKKVKLLAGYYYMGWVLEAIRQSIETDDQTKQKWWKYTNYTDFLSPRPVTVQNDTLSRTKSVEVICKNPADIPIDIDWLDSILNNSVDSIFSVIPQVVRKGSEVLQATLSCISNPNGFSLNIKDMGDYAFKGAQATKDGDKGTYNTAGLLCVISAENSLIENVSFSSQVPKELTYGLDVLINTDNGAAALYTAAKDSYEQETKAKSGTNKELSALAKAYSDFSPKIMGEVPTQDPRITEWKKYLRSSKVPQDKLYQSVIENNTVPVGFAIRNYFNTLQLQIHGTAGVPPFSPIVFRGFLKGIDGMYVVYQSTDQLSINGATFTTTLDCKLIEPLG